MVSSLPYNKSVPSLATATTTTEYGPLRRNKRSWCCSSSGGGSIASTISSDDALPPRKILKVVSVAADDRATVPDNLHPHHFLVKRLQENGLHVKVRSYDELDGFFHKPLPEEIEAYGVEVVEAVRRADIGYLRKFSEDGRPLKCSNRFGESLLHLACRRQLTDVVDFLLNEANVEPTIRDDYGRSPLHDALWTPTPNFELVDLLLARCPDLLYIKDKRGHTPLFYARQSHWTRWIEHLTDRIDSLAPTSSDLLGC